MYNYSMRFQQLLDEDKRNFIIKLKMEVKDIYEGDVTYNLTNEDIWEEGLSVDSATSITSEFTVGGLVSSKLSVNLVNDGERFSNIDFIDGTLTLWVGMDVDGEEEMEKYGVYTISDAKVSFERISIEALDNLSKLAHDYETGISFPCNATSIIRNSCNACGVVPDASSIPKFLDNYTIANPPGNSTITYASLVSYCAQIAGCYVHADHNGRLALDWYALNLLNEKADGGTFAYDGLDEEHEPEAQLDGGSFDSGTPSYKSGDDYDGGTFRDAIAYHVLNDLSSMEVDTDDVVITGVKVTSMPVDLDVEADATFLGVEGYVIEINQNPLIQAGQSSVVAQQLFNVLAGMRFRPLNASVFPTPMLEAGDVGLVSDYNGNYYACFFSTVKFSPDTYCSVTCDAQSANRQSNSMQSALAQVLNQAKQWVAYEKNAREVALDNMSSLTANALGFFSTEVKTSGGGIIRYMHNKPRLEDSAIQWKLTENGFVVSTDYGQTWSAGITSDGNAVVNVLSAIGISADWINAGSLIVGSKNVNTDGEIIGYNTDNELIFKLDQYGLIAKNINVFGGKFESAYIYDGRIVLPYNSSDPRFKCGGVSIDGYKITNGNTSITEDTVATKYIDFQGMKYEGNWLYINDSVTSSPNMLVTSKGIKDYVDSKSGGSSITVDSYLSPTSTNPVQNKVVYSAFSKKADISGTYGGIVSGGLVAPSNSNAKAYISSAGNFIPVSSMIDIMQIGTASNYWSKMVSKEFKDVSDRRKKTDFEPLSDKYHDFANIVKTLPCRYHFKDNVNGAYHTGFVAQDIEQALYDSGLDNMDFAGVESGSTYTLDYTALVPILFNELRLQDEKINQLEKDIEELKEVIKNGN